MAFDRRFVYAAGDVGNYEDNYIHSVSQWVQHRISDSKVPGLLFVKDRLIMTKFRCRNYKLPVCKRNVDDDYDVNKCVM